MIHLCNEFDFGMNESNPRHKTLREQTLDIKDMVREFNANLKNAFSNLETAWDTICLYADNLSCQPEQALELKLAEIQSQKTAKQCGQLKS